MKRVKRNTKYYFIIIANGTGLILSDIETYKVIDKERFDAGNYFADKPVAIDVANKIKQLFLDNKNNN